MLWSGRDAGTGKPFSAAEAGWTQGALFRSFSDRNYGTPLSVWNWSKTVRRWALDTGLPQITTHTFRHLRLTHLARAGWKLHELATYAGHREPRTTQIYIHLSGSDLAGRIPVHRIKSRISRPKPALRRVEIFISSPGNICLMMEYRQKARIQQG